MTQESGGESGPEERRKPRHRRRPALPSAGPTPDEASLHEAALAHLARFAATEAGLRRVLLRRVERWARRAEAEAGGEGGSMAAEEIARRLAAGREAATAVARRLVAAGAVDDAAFAAARARRLNRAGRSRRAIAAHLAAKGVGTATARAALPEAAEDELAAALAHCRRRHVGPFARDGGAAAGEDAEARRKALAALARAGFARDAAEAALDMDPAEAEARLLAHRRE